MIIPIRCLTCGSMVSSKWNAYQRERDSADSNAEHNLITNDIDDLKEQTKECKALDAVGVKRYCCRRQLLAQTDVIDIL